MRIYLDDCADAEALARALRTDGHEVFTPRTENLLGARDPIHLNHAAQRRFVLLTKNPTDFRDLHVEYERSGRSHSGILLVYEYRIRAKNMTEDEIVAALRNLERSGIPIENEIHNLNHWR